jgi:hypothetical protein
MTAPATTGQPAGRLRPLALQLCNGRKPGTLVPTAESACQSYSNLLLEMVIWKHTTHGMQAPAHAE